MPSNLHICPTCGAERRRPYARFCHKCGHALTPVTAPSSRPRAKHQRNRLAQLLIGFLVALGVIAVVMVAVQGRSWMRQWTPPDTETPVRLSTKPPTLTPTEILTSTPDITATPATTSTPIPTVAPKPTDAPLPTATPIPTNTPVPTSTPAPIPIVTVDKTVWLRTGPGTDYDRIRKLNAGESAIAQGRNTGGDWLQVKTQQNEVGWVFSQFLTLEIDIFVLPELQATPLPRCAATVDSRLKAAYQHSLLGCATNSAHTSWAAWESFQRGAMLWRDDIDQITVFYNQDGWTTLPDQWTGQATPSRGSPPPGLQQPIRGFGWMWGNRDKVFDGIGWATDEEKGVCLIIQDFQRGFILLKSSDAYCQDRAGNSNYSRAAELPSLFIAAYDTGRSWRTY